MESRKVAIEESWRVRLQGEFDKEYMQKLRQFLLNESQKKKVIFPKGSEIFSALNLTPLDEVKVVILGQDPYHGPYQAHGLCFSVNPGVTTPPSLVNIFKELHDDLGCFIPNNGYLVPWAKQGVLLLNTVLTVERGRAASHHGVGWEQFTDKVIEILNSEKEGLVFVLWGSPAQQKAQKINPDRHLILKAPHPSPLSAYRGFFGCRHFSQINRYLRATKREEINWQIPLVPGALNSLVN